MQWEQLTAPEFISARKSTGGVCVLSLGSVEKHFDHLPLGTDYLYGHKIACLAAQREPAVVFPPYYLTQNNSSRAHAGALALDADLTLKLLLAVCDEIGRNGFAKIVVFNAHGGNSGLLLYLLQTILHDRKPYAIYVAQMTHERQQQWNKLLKTAIHGHACECETSNMLALYPDLVKMKALRGRKADPLKRLWHLPAGNVMGYWWADYPEHYAGDARAASAATGKKLVELQVENLARYIAAVKKDKAALKLLQEFYDRCERGR